jgi:hypothetical protein
MPQYILRPMGNAVVPMSDGHSEWKHYTTIRRPYSNHREMCQCLSLSRVLRTLRGRCASPPDARPHVPTVPRTLARAGCGNFPRRSPAAPMVLVL